MKSKLLLNSGIVSLLLLSMILMLNYSVIFSYFTLAYMLIIAIVAFGYKPCKSSCTPSCDVLIPAFNEGKHVYKTIRSVMASNYPEFHVTA
ncbi:MAG: hypothetical protein IJV93_08250, partial [Lentisphaeria bacterium]|nr:hypothetical protein [Lentisphaeria bacterium]